MGFKMKVLLVTGGAGFIGVVTLSNILETQKDFTVVNYDKLTYAGNLDNLRKSKIIPGMFL